MERPSVSALLWVVSSLGLSRSVSMWWPLCRVVVAGRPEEVAGDSRSYTGQFLKGFWPGLKGRASPTPTYEQSTIAGAVFGVPSMSSHRTSPLECVQTFMPIGEPAAHEVLRAHSLLSV